MSHVYIVTSANYTPGTADPQVTVVGTVDGIPVTVQAWLSAIVAASTAGGITAVKNLVAPLMLAASVVVSPPTPVAPVQLPTGTFTQ